MFNDVSEHTKEIYNEIKANPADMIMYYRQKIGITQQHLANALTLGGVSVASIQAHEYGKHKPRANFMWMYAKYFSEALEALEL